MRKSLSIELMEHFLHRVESFDPHNKLKLVTGSDTSGWKFMIKPIDHVDDTKANGYFIYCDDVYCTVYYRNTDEGINDPDTLVPENIDIVVAEVINNLIVHKPDVRSLMWDIYQSIGGHHDTLLGKDGAADRKEFIEKLRLVADGLEKEFKGE